MAAVGALFWDLLTNYVQFGWPFLILHVVVLGLSVWAWWGLFREIRHLKGWSRGNAAGGSQATRILDQFITESRELGAQGFLVPITDFSDRLDSIVGGKVTELYERINLFLIVGIAGTLFGVFSFASQATHILNNQNLASDERIVHLGDALSSSLANAFPVGFIGLVLMFIGQVGVSIWENRLKQTVAAATSKALEQRTLGIRSQARIVENAAQRIETALQPLEHLQETMAKHLAPVVEKLGERLDESLELVKVQFSELKETTKLFASAGDALGGRVEALGANIGKLDEVLRRVPDVLANFESTQKAQQEVIRTFQANLDASLQASHESIRALETAAGAARTLPEQILAATGEALRNVSEEISTASGVMVGELKQRLTADYNHLFQRVEEMVSLLRQTVSEASDELARHLKESATDLFAGVQTQATALEGLVKSSEEHLRASLDASQGTISALADMSRSAQDLPSEILETSKIALHQVVEAVVNTSNTMADDLKAQIQTSSENLFQQATDQAKTLRDHLDTTANELLSRLSSSSEELFGGVKGQVEAVQKLVEYTTGQLQAINEAASEAVKGLQGLREEAKGSLVSSFAGMSEESGRLWKEMSDRFGRQTQNDFADLLQTTRDSVREIRNSLGMAAKNWADLANNAETVIREPIAEVLRSVGDELQKGIRNLDNLMAQRYPEVVRDVGAFTRELQGVLAQAEAVQKALDRWAGSVARSQENMEAARQRFLENLAQPITPRMEMSSEMASLLEKELGKQLMPVRSKLSQMDRSLEELRRRRDPMAWLPPKGQGTVGARPGPRPERGVETDAGPAEENPNRPPEPPEAPRTFWGRLWSRFRG